MLTRLSVWWLTRQLKKDKGFWISYQSNIAMSFYDAVKKFGTLTTNEDTHFVANEAANNFMNLWLNNKVDSPSMFDEMKLAGSKIPEMCSYLRAKGWIPFKHHDNWVHQSWDFKDTRGLSLNEAYRYSLSGKAT